MLDLHLLSGWLNKVRWIAERALSAGATGASSDANSATVALNDQMRNGKALAVALTSRTHRVMNWMEMHAFPPIAKELFILSRPSSAGRYSNWGVLWHFQERTAKNFPSKNPQC